MVGQPSVTARGLPAAHVLSTSDADLTAMASDFGNYIRRMPLAVLHPSSGGDIASVVRMGRERGIPVVPRGAGHAVDGQAQIRNGIVVNMPALARVAAPGADRVIVDAGASWQSVVDVTVPLGLVPPVLPDYLPLTVGGTLSAGGVGGTSHQFGSVSDNVYSLEVVTPDGDLVTCSPEVNPQLFDAVRGTQGEHGIIVRAALALTEAKTSVRRYLLSYRDLHTFLADQRFLATSGRFSYVAGQAVLAPDGGWRYLLEAVVAFTPPGEPDDGALLGVLHHDRGAQTIATIGFREFLGRLAPLVDQLVATGSWQNHPHPRCNVMLPGQHAERIISGVLNGLTPELLGLGGSVLLIAIPTARIAAPNVPKARDPLTVLFGVQRTAAPGNPSLLVDMRLANAALHARARSAGGASYTHPTAYHKALHDVGDE